MKYFRARDQFDSNSLGGIVRSVEMVQDTAGAGPKKKWPSLGIPIDHGRPEIKLNIE